MKVDFMFFFNSVLLGVGLAMDAFSVSLADGLSEPCMKKKKLFGIAGVFGVFQGVMPLIGWVCVHTVLQYFEGFQKFIPWIALALLSYIGGKMLYETIVKKEAAEECKAASLGAIMLQGLATSIDALSVGFTIAEHTLSMALIAVALIALVTFGICVVGLILGKKFGTKFAGKAQIFGGVILIAIGLEIFVTGIF